VIEAGVSAVPGEELFVCALPDDAAFIKNEDAIG
jgi:hypothetical protein